MTLHYSAIGQLCRRHRKKVKISATSFQTTKHTKRLKLQSKHLSHRMKALRSYRCSYLWAFFRVVRWLAGRRSQLLSWFQLYFGPLLDLYLIEMMDPADSYFQVS